jgi:hypothetical protein
LRSLADAGVVANNDNQLGRRDSINIVRYGVSTKTTTRQ